MYSRKKKKSIKDIITYNIQEDEPEKNHKAYYEILFCEDIFINILKEFGDKLPQLIVKKSNIHGNGVFALQDIPKGTLTTFYPVHFIFTDDVVSCENKQVGVKMFVSPILDENLINENFFKVAQDYLLSGSQKELFKIGGHPQLYEDYQNGHIINHSKNANSYFQLVNGPNNNCNIWMIISTRNIKNGEELTVNYGPRYYDK